MEKILSKEEIITLVNNLVNPVDKFIVYGIFSGLAGSAAGSTDIRKLKPKDVNLEKNTITLDEKVIFMDETLRELVIAAIKQDVYVNLGDNTKTNEDFLFNMSCEYIIKPRPSKLTANGLNIVSSEALRAKMQRLSKELETDVTPRALKKAGALNVLASQKKDLTIREAEDYLKEKGFNMRRTAVMEILKILKNNIQE